MKTRTKILVPAIIVAILLLAGLGYGLVLRHQRTADEQKLKEIVKTTICADMEGLLSRTAPELLPEAKKVIMVYHISMDLSENRSAGTEIDVADRWAYSNGKTATEASGEKSSIMIWASNTKSPKGIIPDASCRYVVISIAADRATSKKVKMSETWIFTNSGGEWVLKSKVESRGN